MAFLQNDEVAAYRTRAFGAKPAGRRGPGLW